MRTSASNRLHSVRRARRRRLRRRRRGAVMLVVLLILMVATASAAVAMGTVQSELQAAGNDRVALQTQYLAETAINTTLAWIDLLSDSGQWLDTWDSWRDEPPNMAAYGELAVTPTMQQGFASRTTMEQQDALVTDAANERSPVVAADPDATDVEGKTGVFGPRVAYRQVDEGYVVDVTDCQQAPTSNSPGSPVGGGPGSSRVVRFYCVLTARARLVLPEDAAGPSEELSPRTWKVLDPEGELADYTQSVFMNAHDARATILTPAMIVSTE